MGRKRSNTSLMTKLEKMIIGEELFTEASPNTVNVYIKRVYKKFPNRKYTRLKLYTHKGATFHTLKDFKPITCIIRFE